jgi:hypothetical protein
MSSPNFGNSLSVLHCEYDFTVQGGGVGDIALSAGDNSTQNAQLPAGATILAICAAVQTAPTSGGGATIMLTTATDAPALAGGLSGALPIAQFAVSNGVNVTGILTNTPLTNPSVNNYMTVAQNVQASVATAALTAGRIHWYILYTNGFI